MDQLLAGHSALTVMEEKDPPRQPGRGAGRGTPLPVSMAWPASGPTNAPSCVAATWPWAADLLGGTLGPGRCLVDKLPLNILNLWLIQGLFPAARVIVALRDPRDVCISCFANLFRLEEGLAGFPSLEETARLYAATMALYQQARQTLPLAFHELRYETLLEDFPGEARRLFAFLELPWEEAVLDYGRTARSRSIVTPSYHQVTQPLYRHAEGRWRHYDAAMAPVLPLLAPFVAAFGYDEAETAAVPSTL